MARKPSSRRARPGRRVVGLRVRGRIYRAVLRSDLKVGGYTVRVPALSGCLTEGDTLAEAKRMTKEAIELWLAGRAAKAPEPCDGPCEEGATLKEGDTHSVLRINVQSLGVRAVVK